MSPRSSTASPGGVVVVGSFAVGLTLRADAFPVAGQTVLGTGFDQGPGGKGSNQAVQIARLGVPVELVAVLGQDAFAELARALHRSEGVGTAHVMSVAERPTGVGFIVIDAAGENTIVLDPGANALLTPERLALAAPALADASVVLTQLEIPVGTALAALEAGRRAGALTVLNPAPAQAVPPELLAAADVVTPNQTEARILLGRPPDGEEDDEELASALLARGAGAVVLTRGAAGALVSTPEGATAIPAVPVAVVDTTGAGDAFSATLAAGLACGLPLEAAAHRAAAAGALACTRLGVIPGLPTAEALETLLAVPAVGSR